MRLAFKFALLLSSLALPVRADEAEVTINRTNDGGAYIVKNGGVVKTLTATVRPKGYTPAAGEKSPYFNFYSWKTAVTKLNPNGTFVAADDFTSLIPQIYKVTRVSDGSFVWFCLSNTSIGGGNYVNQWSFYAQTPDLYDPTTDEESGAPYFNDSWGDPLNGGWQTYTVEVFDGSVSFP